MVVLESSEAARPAQRSSDGQSRPLNVQFSALRDNYSFIAVDFVPRHVHGDQQVLLRGADLDEIGVHIIVPRDRNRTMTQPQPNAGDGRRDCKTRRRPRFIMREAGCARPVRRQLLRGR